MTLRGQGTRAPGGVPFPCGVIIRPPGYNPNNTPTPAPIGTILMWSDGAGGYIKLSTLPGGWLALSDLSNVGSGLAGYVWELQQLAQHQPELSELAARVAELVRGGPAIGSFECPANTGTNNLTLTIGGVTFESWEADPFTPTGGAVVPIDLRAASTAHEYAELVQVAIHATGACTVDAPTAPPAATIACVAKTAGYAGNVAISGTLPVPAPIGMAGGYDPVASLWPYEHALEAVGADALAGARGLTQVTGTLGTPAAIYDVAGLAGDTKGGFEILFSLVHSVAISSPADVELRINTVPHVTDGTVAYQPAGLILYTKAGVTGDDGGAMVIRVTCAKADSALPARQIEIASIGVALGTRYKATVAALLVPADGEIASIGLQVLGLGQFAAASSHVITRRIAP